MTLTRLLNEIKLTDKKIQSLGVETALFAGVVFNDKVQRSYTKEEIKKSVQGVWDRLTDLTQNRKMLKDALLKANNETVVKVAGKEYTIASAIDRKNYIAVEKHAYQSILRQIASARSEYENALQVVEDKIEAAVEAALGSDSSKRDEATVKGIADGVRANNKVEFYDPCGLEEATKEKLEAIEEFESEVDFVLSEANATTTIDI